MAASSAWQRPMRPQKGLSTFGGAFKETRDTLNGSDAKELLKSNVGKILRRKLRERVG
jgi:hypothetical protein